ncbi:hypothetical protein ABZ746_05050 [Streptomyces sp. NPDC020096]
MVHHEPGNARDAQPAEEAAISVKKQIIHPNGIFNRLLLFVILEELMVTVPTPTGETP